MKHTLILLFAATLFVGCSTITPITQQTPVWRVTDKTSSAGFLARDLKVHLHSTGGMAVAEGTITITPTQGHDGPMAHVDSDDSWSIPFVEGSGYNFDAPHGTEVTSDVNVSGTAFVTTGGLVYQSINGNGYDFVTFRDIQSGKLVKLTKVSATEVMAGDIPGLLPK